MNLAVNPKKMKSTYYISPEDFFKMVDSTDRTPTLHSIENNGTRTPIEPKRKIATVIPSSVKISSKGTNSRQYISPEDFFRMVDSKDSIQISVPTLKKEEKTIKVSKKTKQPKRTRKISKPVTIPEGRLTEPKKRCLLRRIMLQSKYNSGEFDYIEDEYDDLTQEEMSKYKNSSDKEDRAYYKEVQAYEDAIEDVTVKKGWTAFKVGLATILLCTSIGVMNHTMQEIYAAAPEPPVIITMQDATEEQINSAKNIISSIKSESEYDFQNLTYQEQVDAALRIPSVESQINVRRFQGAIMNFGDQELLEEIIQEAFGEEEFNSYSENQKHDLKKLAYELLDESKKEYSRDPQVLKEIAERKEKERQIREANQAEVEARLQAKSENNEDDIELE